MQYIIIKMTDKEYQSMDTFTDMERLKEIINKVSISFTEQDIIRIITYITDATLKARLYKLKEDL